MLFCYYLWGNNLDAKWGLQDDHEIIDTLGPSQDLKISEFWKNLLKTEIAAPGSALRFRPAYSILRLSEMFLWGASPFKWYLSDMILFSFFILILWLTIDKYVGFIAGLLFTMYLVSFQFWGDIMARLGRCETYAVFGTALYILGYVNTMELINKKDTAAGSSLSNWILIVAGSFIAMGSKENFLFLLVPSIILLIVLYRKELHGKISILSLSLVLGYGALISAVLIVALSKARTDMYASSIAPSGRLYMAIDGFKNVFSYNSVLFGIAAAALLLGAVFFYLVKQNDTDKQKLFLGKAAKYLGIAFLLLLGYVSQYVFYNGDWPSQANGRYNVPGLLAGPYLILIIVLLLLEILNIIRKPAIWRKVILFVFSFVLIVLIARNGFEPLRHASKRNAETTQKGMALISKIALTMRYNPGANLLFLSNDSMIDYEFIEAVATFLRSYKVENNFYIFVDQNSYQNVYLNSNSGLGKLTTSRLLDLSFNGSQDYKKFSPLNLLNRNESCYYISFSGESTALPWCKNLAIIG